MMEKSGEEERQGGAQTESRAKSLCTEAENDKARQSTSNSLTIGSE